MKMTRKNGFTLIELLVVIAIIALLLSIIIPALGRAKEITRRTICAAQFKQIGTAMKMYSDAFDGSLPTDHGEMHAYVVYRDNMRVNGKLTPMRWAYLYELNYIETPEIFYCPGNRLGWAIYENYTKPTPWGTLPQDINAGGNQWVRIGYTYFPLDRTARSGLNEATKYAQLNPNLPYAADLIQSRTNISHQRRSGRESNAFQESNRYSLNALYSDGHVANCNDPDVFRHSVWDNFVYPYNDQYYTVLRLIGSQ